MKEQALKLHLDNKGKVEMRSKMDINNAEELSLVYSPGVAYPCLEIKDDINNVYKYTSKSNTVMVVSDGSAVLGLGNIGAHASIPVMEGKSCLFKSFANIDSFPICIDSQDTEDIIKTVKLISPTVGAINLEDISSPRCVEIERRLKSELNIPVFHDDQHGTSIVTLAGLINSCKLLNKDITSLSVVVSGTGAAGSNIIRMLKLYGVKDVYAYNIAGPVTKDKYDTYDFVVQELIDENLLSYKDANSLSELVKDTDCFVGVSAKDILTKDMVKTMNKDSIIFAMANPSPEIDPKLAKEAGCRIIGTGRSDYPNQVNNCLAFPGIFRGALDSGAPNITDEMKIAASEAIANVIKAEELKEDYIIPSPFDKRVVESVSKAVKDVYLKK